MLSGISLDLREDRIGLIGMNGAGKTQLLRLIAGLAFLPGDVIKAVLAAAITRGLARARPSLASVRG